MYSNTKARVLPGFFVHGDVNGMVNCEWEEGNVKREASPGPSGEGVENGETFEILIL